MAKLLQPLSSQVPIVDPATGRPTPFFMQLLQKLGLASGLSSSNGQITIANGGVTNAMLANMASKLIKGNKEAVAGPPEDLTLSQVLDLIGGATWGDILFRGTAGWQRLAAGAAGLFLQTAGVGANPLWAAAGAGGGLTVYFAQNNVSGSTGATPTVQTAVITVAIPASNVARTFMVNGNISWQDGGHAMRGGVLRDATQVWPNLVASNQGADPVSTADGLNHLEYAGILVTVPGDSAAHNISLSWESSGSTAAITVENRQITAIQIA